MLLNFIPPQIIFHPSLLTNSLLLCLSKIGNIMRRIITAVLFAGLHFAQGAQLLHNFPRNSLNITVGSKHLTCCTNEYPLTCQGAFGQAKYSVSGLPEGVSLNGDRIEVTANAKSGNYVIKIQASDEAGQSTEKIVNLSIVTLTSPGNSSSNSGTGANIPFIGPNNGQNPGNNPSGGNPTGSNPQGNGPTGTSPNPSPQSRLDSILNTYSSITDPIIPDYSKYPNGKYPEISFPTGSNENVFNQKPAEIQTQQTPPSDSNRNTITADDVALRAASERHQNAIKGITNLIRIIDQARANKNRAQNDVQAYTTAYNEAVGAQRFAQNSVINAEAKSSQISSAIGGINSSIDELRTKINNEVALRQNLTAQKNNLAAIISNEEKQKTKIVQTLSGINQKLASNVNKLSDAQSKCESIDSTVSIKNQQLKKSEIELIAVNSKKVEVAANIVNQAKTVSELRDALNRADKELADAKIHLSNIEGKQQSLPLQINALKNQLQSNGESYATCKSEAQQIQNIVNSLKTDDVSNVSNKITDLEQKITSQKQQVYKIDASIAKNVGTLENLKSKLNQSLDDLAFLKNQKNIADEGLRQNYASGNDANTKVNFAKQNLDAITKRYQDQAKNSFDATRNLERARAEQALARLALEELIAKYSDALPYAIVPNGNGLTNNNSGSGNNPSGSPLGPVSQNGNGAPGSYQIGDWTNYLSNAYGAGVNPAYPGSVNELFPFNFLSGVNGNNVVNSYDGLAPNNNQGVNGNETNGKICGGNSPQKVATGVITSVGADNFSIRLEDGTTYNIGIIPCTKLTANKANYKMKPGNQAIVKGYAQGKNTLKGLSVTCLA